MLRRHILLALVSRMSTMVNCLAHWWQHCDPSGKLDCLSTGLLNAPTSANPLTSPTKISNCEITNCPPIRIVGTTVQFVNVTFVGSASAILPTIQADEGGAVTAIQANVTFANCRFVDYKSSAQGGALLITDKSFVHGSNCDFVGNSAAKLGGAVFVNDASTFRCDRCRFSGCVARSGGSVYAAGESSSLALLNGEIEQCSATRYGGAVTWEVDCTIIMVNMRIRDVSAGQSGGGLFLNIRSIATLRNVTMLDVGSIGSADRPAYGGCLYLYAACDMRVYDSFFMGCSASGSGGFAFVQENSRLYLANTTARNANAVRSGAFAYLYGRSVFSLNSSLLEDGSPVYHAGAIEVMGNSRFECHRGSAIRGCSARTIGGAIHATDASIVFLRDCQLSANSAEYDGGAIVADQSAIVTLDDSLLVNNSAGRNGGAVAVRDKAKLLLQGVAKLRQNQAGDCGGAIVLQDTAASVEFITTKIEAFENTAPRGSFLCLLAASDAALRLLDLSHNISFPNIDGSIWVDQPSTALSLLRQNLPAAFKQAHFSGRPARLAIYHGSANVSIHVAAHIPGFSVGAVDAFGNLAPPSTNTPVAVHVTGIIDQSIGCNQTGTLLGISTRSISAAGGSSQSGIVEFSGLQVKGGPGRYCFDVRALPGTMEHIEEFPWPRVVVETTECELESESFDTAVGQCVPAVLARSMSGRVSLSNEGFAAVVSACAAVAVILVAVLVYVRRRMRRQTFQMLELLLNGSMDISKIRSLEDANRAGSHWNRTGVTSVDDILHLAYDKQRFEIPKSNLRLGSKLGEGVYGAVLSGKLLRNPVPEEDNDDDDDGIDVAVKHPLSYGQSEHYQALITELKVMAYTGDHDNVVKFHGAVTQNLFRGELYVVMERCACSLIDFLRDEDHVPVTLRLKHPPELCLSLELSLGIAEGMEYLASRGIVHRDLAARNVLLDVDLTAKISDYGLARITAHGYYKSVRVYYSRKGPLYLPIAWMALELLDPELPRRVTWTSDVWSFGVVMWEIFTLGRTPYSDELDFSSESCVKEFYRYLQQGNRLRKPEACPPYVFDLMLKCWHAEPAKRPSFTECSDNISDLLTQDSTSDSREASLNLNNVVDEQTPFL